jgi:hypothetical protein
MYRLAEDEIIIRRRVSSGGEVYYLARENNIRFS